MMLLASVAVYATALLLGFKIGMISELPPLSELLFLVGLASILGMVVSSVACVFLQIWVLLKGIGRS